MKKGRPNKYGSGGVILSVYLSKESQTKLNALSKHLSITKSHLLNLLVNKKYFEDIESKQRRQEEVNNIDDILKREASND